MYNYICIKFKIDQFKIYQFKIYLSKIPKKLNLSNYFTSNSSKIFSLKSTQTRLKVSTFNCLSFYLYLYPFIIYF